MGGGTVARPYDAGPLSGTSGAGTPFSPTDPLPATQAAPARPTANRLSPTRLPIDAADFAELKARARTAKNRPGPARGLHDLAPATAAAVAGGAVAAPAAGAGGPAPASPTITRSFGGNLYTGWYPYDCAMAAGPQDVLVAVNSSVSIFANTGGQAKTTRTLAVWFSNVLPTGATVFDPRAVYDPAAGRWILVAAAFTANHQSWLLLSVSSSGNPMGPWYNYAIDATVDGTTQTNNWADYPAVGIGSDAIYLTANMFVVAGGFAYAKLRVVDKPSVYAGSAVTYKDFTGLQNPDGTHAFAVQPCVNFDAGSEYLVNSLFPTSASPEQSSLTLWTLGGTAGAPTLANASVGVDAYAIPPDAAQPAAVAPLDSGDVRLLAASCRNGSIWTCLTTRHTWDDGSNTAAVQWFELAKAGTVTQQGIYGAAGRHYFFPSLLADGQKNLMVAFARVSPTEFASLYVASRRSGDALGALSPSVQVHAGAAAYSKFDTSGRNRWGDYLAMAADPTDAATVWAYGGFAAGTEQWATWIAAAKA
jgi:hypothetical protein